MHTSVKELFGSIANPSNIVAHSKLIGELISRINEIVDQKELKQFITETTGKNLPSGVAISPVESARNIEHSLRTIKLMLGVFEACRDAVSNLVSDTPLRVLYAGCGPLAPLVMAAAALLPAERIKFVLMDIHEESIQCARTLYKEMGLHHSVEEYIVADAVLYEHHQRYPLNGLVVMAFNKGMEREPQLPITSNLVLQLAEPAFIIPREIDFQAYIVDPREELSKNSINGEQKIFQFNPVASRESRIHLGPLLNLNLLTARIIGELNKNKTSEKSLEIRIKEFDIPQNLPSKKTTLTIGTTIRIYKDIYLNEYETPLNFPHFFMHGKSLTDGNKVAISYVLSEFPGFIHDVYAGE